MEKEICSNCDHRWCLIQTGTDRSPCPICGSTARKFPEELIEGVDLHTAWAGKVNDPSLPCKKKTRLEFFDGCQWSTGLNKWVKKTVTLDRRNNYYYEKVTDPESARIIHECEEPLKDHFGHGSDKFKKDE